MTRWSIVALAACSSSTPPRAPAPQSAAPPPVAQEVAPSSDDEGDGIDARERARRDQLAAAHRKLEEEQQAALAAGCAEPARAAPREQHARCLPSCYPTEPLDPRAGMKRAGAVEIARLVCEVPGRSDRGYVIADELAGAGRALRPVRGRFPAPHKAGTWQAALVAAVAERQRPKPARGDAIVVTRGWRELEHPLTRERLRCATVSHFTRAMRRTLDGCGADGSLACEATGNAAVRGLNVVRYRVAEARRLQLAGKRADCQQAALEAIAVARGMPRWRQYVKLNVNAWVDHAGYRTRFDGTLDEDTLFAIAARLGGEAEAIHAACGGPPGAPTTAAQEQSFHTCW